MLYVMLSVAQDWLSDPTQLHFCARAEHKTLKVTGPWENITREEELTRNIKCTVTYDELLQPDQRLFHGAGGQHLSLRCSFFTQEAKH